MENAFRTVLNMSVTGSYVILAILLARLLLARTPKKYSLTLWAVAGFRLCCPFSFESVMSLFRLPIFDMTAAQADSAAVLTYFPESPAQTITTGLFAVNHYIPSTFPVAPEPLPSQIDWTVIAFWIWVIGMAFMVLHSLVSWWHLRRRVSTAIHAEDNIYRSDAVNTPFVLGFFRPRIYLPTSLSGPELEHVLAHERMHLRKFDPFHKLFAYGVLTLHWFNPLCHLAFRLFARDMEMRCDEAVLAQDPHIRTAYSTTLVHLAVQPGGPNPSPLAFGETGIRTRVKNILRWKKPNPWVSLAAVAMCLVTLVACAANPLQSGSTVEYRPFSLVYRMPNVSAIQHFITAYQPNYRITEDGELSAEYNGDWISLGTLEEFELTEENFDRFFPHSSFEEDGLTVYSIYNGAPLRSQVVSARRTSIPYDTDGELDWDIHLYYVLETADGKLYLASGVGISNDPSKGFITSLVCMIPKSDTAIPLDAETYVTSRCVYQSPVFSVLMRDDSGLTYSVEDDLFVIRYRQPNILQEAFILTGLQWEDFPFTEEEWNRLSFSTDYGYFKDARFLDISLRYFLLEKDGELFLCDGSHDPGEAISMLSTIYQLTPAGSDNDPWVVQFGGYDNLIQRIAALGEGWAEDPSSQVYFELLTQTYDADMVLRYCFTRFLNNDAEGQEGLVLAEVCKEILKNHGEQDIINHSYTDGMDWFRQYRAQAKGYMTTLGAQILLNLRQENQIN